MLITFLFQIDSGKNEKYSVAFGPEEKPVGVYLAPSRT
jgi:hypothetical protein